jgi:hypothetical protein
MTLNRRVLALALGSLLAVVGFVATSALQAADARQETGPVYSVEGAWYGMTDFPGLPSTPTLDTLTSDAQRHGVEGTFLCTLPPGMASIGSLNYTPAAQGAWRRIATNTYAYTNMRAVTSGATPVGWAKFWGTITAVSENELTGTINAQLYDLNLTPVSPVATGTLERHRVEIVFE